MKHVGLCGILSLIVKSSVSSLEILLCLSSLFFVRKTCSLRYRKWLLIQIAIAVCNSSEFSIYGSKFPKAMAGGSMGGWHLHINPRNRQVRKKYQIHVWNGCCCFNFVPLAVGPRTLQGSLELRLLVLHAITHSDQSHVPPSASLPLQNVHCRHR